MKPTLKQFLKEKSPQTVSFRRGNITNAISPYGSFALELVENMRVGSVISFIPCGIPRDPLLLRKFQKMITTAHNTLPESAGRISREAFRKLIIIKAGYYEPFLHCVDGVEVEIRKAASISFENMDEMEFRKLMADCHAVLIQRYGAILPEAFLKDFF